MVRFEEHNGRNTTIHYTTLYIFPHGEDLTIFFLNAVKYCDERPSGSYGRRKALGRREEGWVLEDSCR